MDPRSSFVSRFAFQDRVIIDGGRDLVGVVTGFNFRERSYMVAVSWIHNGTSCEAWIEEWRLEMAEGRGK